MAAGSEDDIPRHLPVLKGAYNDMRGAIHDLQRRGIAGDDWRARNDTNRPWVRLIEDGYKVADAVLSTRSIPDRSRKGLEMAFRLVSNSRRMPKDIFKWWDKNAKRFDLLIKAAEKWPPKEVGGDELFTLGPFTVHNTVGAKGAELDSLKRGIEQAAKAIGKSRLPPGFKKVLYGDIHVVPRIANSHHAAWYFPSDDSLYMRRSKKTGLDEVHALIHELGHRYWRRFADKEAKQNWWRHHNQVESKQTEVDMPDVGEPLPVRVPKAPRGWRPTVESRKMGRYWFRGPNGQDMLSIDDMRIYRLLSKQQKAQKNFPTPYSAKDEEEHFCEALALYVMGVLPDEHEVPFKDVWG